MAASGQRGQDESSHKLITDFEGKPFLCLADERPVLHSLRPELLVGVGYDHVQRYIPHLPAGGEIVIFDRSWYNRAGVERVFGFCTKQQLRDFLRIVPMVEQTMVKSGIILLKYWLEVGPDQQTERLTSRIDDPRKVWKLSAMDLASYKKWDKYTKARDDMLTLTDSEWAPWHTVNSNDKKSARLNVISHLLSQMPYEPMAKSEIRLPKRTVTPDKDPSIVDRRLIETPFSGGRSNSTSGDVTRDRHA